jgi:hypothetical protein
MSDINILKSDLQFKLNIESPSLKYAGQLFARKALFTVDIPYPVLKIWHDIVGNTSGKQENTSSASGQTKSYCDLLESSIPAGVFTFRDSPEVRKEIDESLGKISGSVKALYRKVKQHLNNMHLFIYFIHWQSFKIYKLICHVVPL